MTMHDDPEKGHDGTDGPAAGAAPLHDADPDELGNPIAPKGSVLNRFLHHELFETRGIERVPLASTKPFTWQTGAQAFILWISVNLAAVNVTLGMLGPQVFYLSFADSAACSVLGAFLGSLGPAYMATWGPQSGVRTMAVMRFVMGWFPSKLLVLLNLLQMLGYSLINCVVAGQILSAVAPQGSLSIIVGIVIVAVITWFVTTFGIRVFHFYERYAFIPQIIVLCILYGVAGRKFDLSVPSQGDPSTIIASRVSFLSLCLSAAVTYSPLSADYFVYYSPPRRPFLSLFLPTLAGLTISFAFALVLGAGLASITDKAYTDAAAVSQGALLVAAYDIPLSNFGRFCGVIVALGTVANLIPPTYSAGIDAQLLGRFLARIPRPAWNTAAVIAYAVCAAAGREHLSQIFTNFLALMGYWVVIWLAITLVEHLVFRRKNGFTWEDWDTRSKLTIGLAALGAFLVGWAGAILCMSQVYYAGPLAKLVGEYGIDMGNFVGFAWAIIAYLPLRWLELRYIGR